MHNFALMIPTDIARHPDGTPMSFVQPEEKILFSAYIFKCGITSETWDMLRGAVKEMIGRSWKERNKDLIPVVKREWTTKSENK